MELVHPPVGPCRARPCAAPSTPQGALWPGLGRRRSSLPAGGSDQAEAQGLGAQGTRGKVSGRASRGWAAGGSEQTLGLFPEPRESAPLRGKAAPRPRRSPGPPGAGPSRGPRRPSTPGPPARLCRLSYLGVLSFSRAALTVVFRVWNCAMSWGGWPEPLAEPPWGAPRVPVASPQTVSDGRRPKTRLSLEKTINSRVGGKKLFEKRGLTLKTVNTGKSCIINANPVLCT